MTKFFFLLAWRNIKNNLTHSIVKIVGLSIGICAALIISLVVKFENSYEKFNEQHEQMFILQQKVSSPDLGISYDRFTPSPLPEKLKQDFPEIKNYTRFSRTREKFQVKESSKIILSYGLYTDDSFCSIFTIKFLAGNPENALNEPNKIIITRPLKEKLFGDTDPEECIGKTVIVSENQLCEITAVADLHPRNTEIHYSFLISLKTLEASNNVILDEDWSTETYNVLLLNKQTDYKEFNSKIANYLQSINESFEYKQAFLLPLADNHLNNPDDPKKKKIVYIALLLFAFILLISFVNFVNLRYSNGMTRIKEASLQKVLGARKIKIIFQWIGESALITFFSFDLALILAELFLPIINRKFGYRFKLINADNWKLILLVLVLTIVVGIISGTIPALRIASLKITTSLKNQFKSPKSKIGAKKALLAFQISLTVIFISAMLIMRMQVNYQKNKDKGFNEKNILIHSFYASTKNRNKIDQFHNFAQNIKSNPAVKDFSISTSVPFINFYNYINCHAENKNENNSIQVGFNKVDLNYISTLEIQIIEGRTFNDDDNSNSVCIINETAKRKLGLDNPIGTYIEPLNLQIIGIAKDYHIGDMNWPIYPLVVGLRDDTTSYAKNVLSFRINEDNIAETKNWISEKSKEFFPDNNISYKWLEEYTPISVTKAINGIFEVFSFIAICISIIGLFGMVSYTTVARSKEIGVRKVMGADSKSIFNLLLRSHLRLVIIANIIAWPIAYFIMKMFLQIFAYRISIPYFVFILTGVITFFIMFATVGYHILKASRTNPIKELRYE